MDRERRWAYLDALKALAIFCVCLYHFPIGITGELTRPLTAGLLTQRFFRGLCSVCVPLFMMVNGALLLSRPFDARRHFVRCAQLFVSLYVWYLLTMTAAQAWAHGAGYLRQNMAGILYSALFLYEYDGVTMNHLWFMQMLLAVYLIAPCLKAALDSPDAGVRQWMKAAGLLLVLLCFATRDFARLQAVVPVLRHLDLSGLETMNPFRGVYGAMVVYFVLGGWLHTHREAMLRVPPLACAVLLAGGAALLFAEWLLASIRTGTMVDIVYNGYDCVATLMLSTGLFITAAKLEVRCPMREGAVRALRLVGRNTLAVYYLHWLLGLTVLSGLSLPACFPMNQLKALALVAVCSLLGEAMRRVPVLRRLV